jgi:hypothetical protein
VAAVAEWFFLVCVWTVGVLGRAGVGERSHLLSLSAEGQGCTAYDVAVNSDFYRRMQVGGQAVGEVWAEPLPLTLQPTASLLYCRTAISCGSS